MSDIDAVRDRLLEENRLLREELETYRRDTGHIVDLRADGWTIQHPLTCRPNLFDCIVNYAAASFMEHESDAVAGRLVPGRYRVNAEDGKLVIVGDRL